MIPSFLKLLVIFQINALPWPYQLRTKKPPALIMKSSSLSLSLIFHVVNLLYWIAVGLDHSFGFNFTCSINLIPFRVWLCTFTGHSFRFHEDALFLNYLRWITLYRILIKKFAFQALWF